MAPLQIAFVQPVVIPADCLCTTLFSIEYFILYRISHTKITQEGVDITTKQLNYIQQNMEQLEQQLKNLPKGNLICARNGTSGRYIKWYVDTGNGYRYLPKAERKLAQKLALRKIITLQLSKLTQEYELLNQYESFLEVNSYFAEMNHLLSEDSPFFELLSGSFHSFKSTPGFVQTWTNEPYVKNQSRPEHLLHKSLSGEKLRSKSEVIIANALYMNHIPYRYECELSLGDVSLHPDFTILHPVTSEIFYWEHFGMMDIPAYRESTYQKLRLYGEHHIYPGERLITTYESETSPLDSENIQKIITQNFL